MKGALEIKTLKVLIVDDDDHFRQTLRELLMSRFPSFSFEEARDGKEALEKIEVFLPDLVFMDIKLPGENGLELTKKIKRTHPAMVIIILTGYDLPEYKQAAQESGADHFASKESSSAKEILGLVESILL
ncbi:MAG: response regulator transcription factor [Desulfobacterales bacterium]|nr:response regulator transcription factor [Desulfobacterales bacterium]